ncbi:MAG: hypothetical protein QOJ62_201 [Actinomycetota bacterium]|nr:hypothetical protein [Actinomycetota bacterium]
MPAADSDFVAVAGTPVDLPGAVTAALESVRRLRVVAEPTRDARRTWFDTFDWRLHKAGLLLEHKSATSRNAPPVASVALHSSAGVITAADTTGDVRRAFPFDAVVPAGRLRDRLQPVVEMRALVPVATVQTRTKTLRVLNDDDKTVARVALEDSAAIHGRARHRLAARVTVLACRGYDDEAAALTAVLAKVAGLAASDRSTLAHALDALGRKPGDYTGKLDVHLADDMSTELAVRVVMGQLADAAQVNLAGVVADTDTEFLHDLRVAVRRARSVLKLVGAALPTAQADAARSELKWLGDLTTPTRDLDVYLLGLDALAAEAGTGSDVDQLEPFRTFLAARRSREQKALVRGLRSARGKRAFSLWTAIGAPTSSDPAAQSVTDDATELGRAPVGAVAQRCVDRTFRKVIRAGSAITAASPASALHDLRKRCKELRYALEIFASLQDANAHRALVADLKTLQDCLGEFQDTEVQQHAIRRFAEEMLAGGPAAEATAGTAAPPVTAVMPVMAVMAMGRIADRLEQRQVAARARFASLFAEFAGPKPRAHLAALYGRRP